MQIRELSKTMLGLGRFEIKCTPQTLGQVDGKKKTAKQNSHWFLMKQKIPPSSQNWLVGEAQNKLLHKPTLLVSSCATRNTD